MHSAGASEADRLASDVSVPPRACSMFTPAAAMAAGVKRTPSVNSTMGMVRKKDAMVIRENRLMLSIEPCVAWAQSALACV